jgi:hypothetical protein
MTLSSLYFPASNLIISKTIMKEGIILWVIIEWKLLNKNWAKKY